MLNKKQEGIVIISAYTAKGEIDNLKLALNEGLDAGLTINEIKEILVQMYAYTGFPRSLNGLSAFMDVLREREQKGVKDDEGKEPNPIRSDKSIHEQGTEVQTYLVGQPVQGGIVDFAPAIDQYLKKHLFGDIFGRDNLDYQNRELATLGALAALGVDGQLQSHLNISINIGITPIQLQQLASVLSIRVGAKEGDLTTRVLNDVLKK